jgi:hypothetical protein
VLQLQPPRRAAPAQPEPGSVLTVFSWRPAPPKLQVAREGSHLASRMRPRGRESLTPFSQPNPIRRSNSCSWRRSPYGAPGSIGSGHILGILNCTGRCECEALPCQTVQTGLRNDPESKPWFQTIMAIRLAWNADGKIRPHGRPHRIARAGSELDGRRSSR